MNSRPSRLARSQPRRTGFIRQPVVLALVVLAIFGISSRVLIAHTHADAAINDIKSGVSGYCLDDYQDHVLASNKVVSWKCNDSAAQNWRVEGLAIKHQASSMVTQCLSVNDDAKVANSALVARACGAPDLQPGQVWLRDRSGYYNPNSGLCLTAARTDAQLTITDCTHVTAQTEVWLPISAEASPDTKSIVCGTTQGEKIACAAEQQWSLWQTGTPDHTTLLNDYTLNTSYEEWCADFVSYVYKQAGYPFTNGEADGWNENDANQIQNMGFTYHDASDYTPKVGDVAYFDYSGGHVEIVISGGKNPSFIYGNSAAIDPTTGNGEMQANTVVNDKLGQVTYYLSPN